MDVLRAGLRQAAPLLGTALLLAGTGTLVGAVFRSDLAGLAGWSAGAFRLMVVLLPLVVLLTLLDDGTQPGGSALVAAALGAPASCAVFLAVSTIVGPLVRRLDPIAYSEALRGELGWGWPLAVVAVSLATAVPVAGARLRRGRPGTP